MHSPIPPLISLESLALSSSSSDASSLFSSHGMHSSNSRTDSSPPNSPLGDYCEFLSDTDGMIPHIHSLPSPPGTEVTPKQPSLGKARVIGRPNNVSSDGGYDSEREGWNNSALLSRRIRKKRRPTRVPGLGSPRQALAGPGGSGDVEGNTEGKVLYPPKPRILPITCLDSPSPTVPLPSPAVYGEDPAFGLLPVPILRSREIPRVHSEPVTLTNTVSPLELFHEEKIGPFCSAPLANDPNFSTAATCFQLLDVTSRKAEASRRVGLGVGLGLSYDFDDGSQHTVADGLASRGDAWDSELSISIHSTSKPHLLEDNVPDAKRLSVCKRPRDPRQKLYDLFECMSPTFLGSCSISVPPRSPPVAACWRRRIPGRSPLLGAWKKPLLWFGGTDSPTGWHTSPIIL